MTSPISTPPSAPSSTAVSYHLSEWSPTPHKIRVDGGLVRLSGYRAQHANTVDVLAAGRQLTLIVLPPDTPAETAHATLMTAGHRGNADDVESLLRSPAS